YTCLSKFRPAARRAERPNGRRRKCGVAKGVDAPARRLRGAKVKPSCARFYHAAAGLSAGIEGTQALAERNCYGASRCSRNGSNCAERAAAAGLRPAESALTA